MVIDIFVTSKTWVVDEPLTFKCSFNRAEGVQEKSANIVSYTWRT